MKMDEANVLKCRPNKEGKVECINTPPDTGKQRKIDKQIAHA